MISSFRKALQAFYRLWFYILLALPIVLFLPLLLISTMKEKWYPHFFWLARNLWAAPVLYGMGCVPRISWEERMQKGKSYMLVANHTSMLDIMLMLRVIRYPFVFIGKKELASIPLFGYFYKRVCILVDRNDTKSRTAVYLRARKRLDQGLSICIFPEGGVPDETILLDNFKDGAFKMAIAHRIQVVPMTFYDNKDRLSFRFFSGSPGITRVKVHSFFNTADLHEWQKTELRDAVRSCILRELQPQGQRYKAPRGEDPRGA
jgi:1-acyl-sn-glycerol-3-phosphate acyltransferase